MADLTLKPCPFCGSADVFMDDCSDCAALFSAQCMGCGVHNNGETRAEAVELWNRRVGRAPGPPTEEEVERAAAVLAIEDGRDWEKPVIREIYGERYAGLARAALTAALGRPE